MECKNTGEILKIKLAGFNPNQKRNKDGTWGDGGKNISKFENEIRNNKKETAALYDKDGNLILIKEGNLSSVSFNMGELVQMRGNTLTHNHPNGLGFSRADITTSLQTGLYEIRAVGKYHDYSMKFKTDFLAYRRQYGTGVWADFKKAYNDSNFIARGKTDDWVQGKWDTGLTLKDANLFRSHTHMTELAENTEFGQRMLIYRRD